MNGAPVRGRCRDLAPRQGMAPFWNQYDATFEDKAKTNNVSEQWHNRFHMLMGQNHQEQGETQIAIVELGLGRKIKAMPKKMARSAKKIDKLFKTLKTTKFWNS